MNVGRAAAMVCLLAIGAPAGAAPAQTKNAEALKQMAQESSWAGRTDESARYYNEYLALRPDDEEAKLGFATMLSWSKEKRHQEESRRRFDEILARRPGDDEARLARARLLGWMGEIAAAVPDYERYIEAHPDPKLEMELATVLSWSKDKAHLARSVRMFDAYLAAHPDDMERRLLRGRVNGWMGNIDASIADYRACLAAKDDPAVRLELARVYRWGGRRLRAISILDDLYAQNPKDEEVRAERESLGLFFRPTLMPSFTFYADRGDINALSINLHGRFSAHRRVSLFADLGAWRLADAAQSLWTGRFDLGVRFRIIDELDLELAGGPRVYESVDTSGGGHAAVAVRPTSWLQLGARYAFDDIYPDLYTPNSVKTGIRGHQMYGEAEATIPGLPFKLTAGARAGGRFVTGNHSIEASGSLTANVWGPFSIGYYGQYIQWDKNDLAYWSPQAYQAHMGVLRMGGEFSRVGVTLEVSASVGAASEHVEEVASSGGWGVAFGGAGSLSWQPVSRFNLRLGFMTGQTVRNVLQVQDPGPMPGMDPPQVVSVTSAYWWLQTSLSLTVIL